MDVKIPTRTFDPSKVRHPEKQRNEARPMGRKPDWIRVKAPVHPVYRETREIVRENNLVTVCEEAGCPNIGECWAKKHATMMIMGEVCTRACTFCNVATGKPNVLDPFEPFNVATAVQQLGLKHVVITSVDRDDLDDGGAQHFADVINAIRDASPETTVEVLTPDFIRKGEAWTICADARPDVYNHNLETVSRLYKTIQPGSDYRASIDLLAWVKQRHPDLFTKSGLMVGLGETTEEVLEAMDHLREADVDFLTIGQYLQPTPKHHPLDRFRTPAEFEGLKEAAYDKGFLLVSSSPLTRSSYHADEDFAALKDARLKALAA